MKSFNYDWFEQGLQSLKNNRKEKLKKKETEKEKVTYIYVRLFVRTVPLLHGLINKKY